jgi:hypothetical protein
VGHNVVNIINVQIKKRSDGKVLTTRLPLFKVDLKMSDNNRDIFEIRTLGHCRVNVESLQKASALIQCKRCQDYGHSANYCTRTLRCVRCGDKHLVKDCRLPKTDPPKCANYRPPHTANYKGCAYYQSKISPNRKVHNHNQPVNL